MRLQSDIKTIKINAAIISLEEVNCSDVQSLSAIYIGFQSLKWLMEKT